jgi:hypothetical protein
VDDLVDDPAADGLDQPVVERVGGRRVELVEHPDEQPGVAGLLAQLVEEVGDPRVGVVVGPGDLEAEPGHEDGLELQAGGGDGHQGLAGQGHDLVGVEAPGVQAGGPEDQVVGEHLAVAHPAGQVAVGVDDAGPRRRVELVDAAGRGRGDGVDHGAFPLPAGVPHGLTGGNYQ